MLLSALLISAAPSGYANEATASVANREWVWQIMRRLNVAKRYPPEAAGQSGTAKVAFRIDRDGHLVSAALLESTGVPALDREALALLERAQPFPAPPAGLTEDRFQFTLPLVYRAPSLGTSTMSSSVAKEDAAVAAKINGICRGC